MSVKRLLTLRLSCLVAAAGLAVAPLQPRAAHAAAPRKSAPVAAPKADRGTPRGPAESPSREPAPFPSLVAEAVAGKSGAPTKTGFEGLSFRPVPLPAPVRLVVVAATPVATDAPRPALHRPAHFAHAPPA